MNDEAQPIARRPWVRGALGIGGFVLASAFGRWAGLSFLIPVGVAAASYFLLRRVMPSNPPSAIQLTAVQMGHLGWFLLALFYPGGLAQVGLDIVVMGGLLIWFGVTRSRKAAYGMLAAQVLSVAMNLVSIGGALEADKLAPLCVHLLLRAIALYLIASFLIQSSRTKATSRAEMFE